jgi:hypothetical protein
MIKIVILWGVTPCCFVNNTRNSKIFAASFLKTEASYRGADKSLARPTSLRILFDGENISFDASLVIYK